MASAALTTATMAVVSYIPPSKAARPQRLTFRSRNPPHREEDFRLESSFPSRPSTRASCLKFCLSGSEQLLAFAAPGPPGRKGSRIQGWVMRSTLCSVSSCPWSHPCPLVPLPAQSPASSPPVDAHTRFPRRPRPLLSICLPLLFSLLRQLPLCKLIWPVSVLISFSISIMFWTGRGF